LHPALVAVLAMLFLHERMNTVKVLALLVALVGMTLTVAPALTDGGTGTFPRLPLGIAFGVAAAAIYSVYIVVGTRLTGRVAPLTLSTIVVASAAVVFVVAATLKGPLLPRSAAGWAAVAGIALVSTVAAITLFFAGLARIGPTRASTLSTIEPVFTIVLAAALLGEPIGTVQAIGGVLILGAVVMLARAPMDKAGIASRIEG
jgi:drug/metabolite transporter (DMT)-like permease